MGRRVGDGVGEAPERGSSGELLDPHAQAVATQGVDDRQEPDRVEAVVAQVFFGLGLAEVVVHDGGDEGSGALEVAAEGG